MNVHSATESTDRNPSESEGNPRRWRWAYAALTLPALAVLTDSTIALARGWHAESRLDGLFVGLAGGWLWGITLLALMPAMRRLMAFYAPQLLLFVGTLCVMTLVAEFVVGRVVDRVGTPFHCWKPGLTMVHRPKPGVMRGVGPEAHAAFNRWGVRGTDPPPRDQAYRILCVGGSSTACTYLDDAKTWPAQLAADLQTREPDNPVWVGNIGMPGFRSGEHARFTGDSPLMQQVDCLVLQTGINDFMSCLAGPRPEPIWTRSSLRSLVRNLAASMADDRLVEDTAGTVYERRRAQRQAAAIVNDSPLLGACLKTFEQNLRAIVHDCRQNKVRLVITTQPVLWSESLDAENAGLLWFGQLPDGRFLSVEQLAEGMRRYNQVVRSVCEENDVELVDLSALNGDPTVFYDDCHLTEEGARRVASAVADWLVAHPQAPREPAAAPSDVKS